MTIVGRGPKQSGRSETSRMRNVEDHWLGSFVFHALCSYLRSNSLMAIVTRKDVHISMWANSYLSMSKQIHPGHFGIDRMSRFRGRPNSKCFAKCINKAISLLEVDL